VETNRSKHEEPEYADEHVEPNVESLSRHDDPDQEFFEPVKPLVIKPVAIPYTLPVDADT